MAINFLVYEHCSHCDSLNTAGPCISCGKKLLQGKMVVKLVQTDYPGIHTLTPQELNDLLGELAGLFNQMSPSQVRDIQAKIDKIVSAPKEVDAPA